MPKQPSTSLIISAYNRSPVLEQCLAGFAAQTVLPDEVILADDGSSDPGIATVFASFSGRLPRLKHIWHADHGFQKSKILNRAIREASGELLVFTDSDCVPERHFVEDHRRLCKPGCFLQGIRAQVRLQHIEGFKPRGWLVAWLCATNGIYHREAAFRSRFLERFVPAEHWNMPLGANFSCWREDILELNGFDERFEGWGNEDVDVFNRLKWKGVQGVFPVHRCTTFHLDHSRLPENFRNFDLFKESEKSGAIRCGQGLEGTELREPVYTCRVIGESVTPARKYVSI